MTNLTTEDAVRGPVGPGFPNATPRPAPTRPLPALPVPKRIGDPSPIKHVLPDRPREPNVRPGVRRRPAGKRWCGPIHFGKEVTPNQHELAKSSRWSTTPIATEPTRRRVTPGATRGSATTTWSGFPRTTVGNGSARGDGLPRSRVSSGTTRWRTERQPRFRANTRRSSKGAAVRAHRPLDSDWYRDSRILEGNAKGQLRRAGGVLQAQDGLPSLDRILVAIRELGDAGAGPVPRDSSCRLKAVRAQGAISEPDHDVAVQDHTAGDRPGQPTPGAMVADNDLALGRIVEASPRRVLAGQRDLRGRGRRRRTASTTSTATGPSPW